MLISSKCELFSVEINKVWLVRQQEPRNIRNGIVLSWCWCISHGTFSYIRGCHLISSSRKLIKSQLSQYMDQFRFLVSECVCIRKISECPVIVFHFHYTHARTNSMWTTWVTRERLSDFIGLIWLSETIIQQMYSCFASGQSERNLFVK